MKGAFNSVKCKKHRRGRGEKNVDSMRMVVCAFEYCY